MKDKCELNGPLVLRNLPRISADILVIFAGVWSLALLAGVYAGLSFNQFLMWAWVPFVVSIVLCIVLLKSNLSNISEYPVVQSDSSGLSVCALRVPVTLLIVAGLLGSMWYYLNIPYWIFWLAALTYLVSLFRTTRSSQFAVEKPDTEVKGRTEAVVLIAVAVLAVFVTLMVNRPNEDDAFYFNTSIAAMDHPDLPMLSFDGMLGDVHLPLTSPYHKAQVDGLLKAVIAKVTGVSMTTLYYVVFPAVFAVFIIIAQWLFIRLYDNRTAWLGLAITFILLLAWGDIPRAYGNFSFLRLFQGKSIAIFVFIPLIIYYARLFSSVPSRSNWMLLMLAQSGAAAFSTTALIVAPITAGITVLSSAGLSKKGVIRALGGWLTSAPLVLILILVFFDMQAFHAAAQAAEPAAVKWGTAYDSSNYYIKVMFEPSMRTPIALLAILALPLAAHAARLSSAVWITRFVFLLYLLVMNNLTGPLLASYAANNFVWRLYWAIPAPALVASALAIGIAFACKAWSNNKSTPGVLVLTVSTVMFAAFLVAGKWTITPSERIFYHWATPKVYYLDYRVAQYVAKHTPSHTVALVAYPVAKYVTYFHHAPPLIAVRQLYLDGYTRYWGKQETLERKYLASYVSNGITSQHELKKMTPWVLRQIDKRNIGTIVTSGKVGYYMPFRQGLVKRGFHALSSADRIIWLKHK